MDFVILAGSFRKNSRTQLLIKQICQLLGPHQSLMAEIDRLPFYNHDLEQNKPAQLQTFLDQVTNADGLICVTPEYNHSIPAVLKNAIDWASRPAFASPLKDKPVCIITQANSPVGGARAQAHLKLVLDSTLARVQTSHEMMVPQINSVFTEDGAISDEKALSRLERHILAFIEFIRQCDQHHTYVE